MRKNTLLIGALALFATGPVLAQDLVIETMKGNENIELVQDDGIPRLYPWRVERGERV